MRIRRSTESGSIRLLLFFLVIMIGCFWKGSQDLYTALTNRRPAAMSYDAYVKTKPKTAWLMLTNCTLDLGRAAYHSIKGANRPYELFIPVSSAGGNGDDTIQVVIATKNPEFIATTIELQSLKSEAEEIGWLMKNRDRIFPRRDVQGLVRFGLEMKESERKKLLALNRNIVKDFTMIDEGSKPSLNSGLGFCGVGFLFLVGGVWYARSNREESASDVL